MTDSLYSIEYSPKAIKDLKGIYSYIAFKLLAPNTAKDQVDRIRATVRSLDIMPSRNPIVDWEPWKSMKMHRVPVDNYAVFYTVEENYLKVTIIRIVYSGRDISKIA
ncbi:MAG: type II toxin-antitoxin system RelE/ParE family toxin [Candidatus Riflebacteria bacterium]|nr:type II toxin-antitoxin system RelE/ParE family toxin [Candidatus Riflebacteria bacterium]